MDKANVLEDLLLDRAADSGDGSAPCVFVGDSVGDVAALLAANVAIVLGSNATLSSALDAFGCVLHAAADAAVPVACSLQPPGHMFACDSWEQIYRLLFAADPSADEATEESPAASTAPPAAPPDATAATAAPGAVRAMDAASESESHTERRREVPRVLVVAGSDSGGGAGIQADVRACMACGAYAANAISALTAQNTLGVQRVHVPPVEVLRLQLRSVLDDIGADVVKTGMLPDAASVRAVADAIRSTCGSASVRLVVDPVMVATSGDALAGGDVTAALKESLLPLTTVLTPNLTEAAALLGACTPALLRERRWHPLCMRSCAWLSTHASRGAAAHCLSIHLPDARTVQTPRPRHKLALQDERPSRRSRTCGRRRKRCSRSGLNMCSSKAATSTCTAGRRRRLAARPWSTS